MRFPSRCFALEHRVQRVERLFRAFRERQPFALGTKRGSEPPRRPSVSFSFRSCFFVPFRS